MANLRWYAESGDAEVDNGPEERAGAAGGTHLTQRPAGVSTCCTTHLTLTIQSIVTSSSTSIFGFATKFDYCKVVIYHRRLRYKISYCK